jgi:hypothetical protein
MSCQHRRSMMRMRSRLVIGLALLMIGAPVTGQPATGEPAPKPSEADALDAPAIAAETSRTDQATRTHDARYSAWQKFAAYVKRPSEIPPAAREELRVHARRMARLARIRALGEYANDQQAVQRADALSERERNRHKSELARLWPALTAPRPKAGVQNPGSEARIAEDEEEAEPEP